MILCDMDGVLAQGPSGDTESGKSIYRTFLDYPEELDRIRADGISLHLVTAKEDAQASQILDSIGLAPRFDSVIGANQLFWPTMRMAIRCRQLPRALLKSTARGFLPPPGERRVVMLEDREAHLREMLDAGAVDFGILVPPICLWQDRIMEWFDLNLAFRLARELSLGALPTLDLSAMKMTMDGRKKGTRRDRKPRGSSSGPPDEDRFLVRLDSISYAGTSDRGPTLQALDTGRILAPAPGSVVNMTRAGRRMLRKMVRGLPGRRGQA